MAELGPRAGACSQLGPIPSHPIPWEHAHGQEGRGARADPSAAAVPHPPAQAVFSGLSRSPSALAALALWQMQPWTGHKSRAPPVAASAEQRRYLQPSPPGLGLLSLLSRAPRWQHPVEHPSLLCPSPADDLRIHQENSGGREQRHGHWGQSIPSHLQNQDQCRPAGYACGGGHFQPKESKQPVARAGAPQESLGHPSHARWSL